MKFMIINKPNGQNYSKTDGKTKIETSKLKAMLDDGTLEVAYATVAGGHIYVVNAKDTEELVHKVRNNPFFHDSDTEIIPLMDALDFLKGFAKAVK